MKKLLISAILITNSLMLTGCLPAIQGASTVSTIITTVNDRRSAGEVLDDGTILFKMLAWQSQDPALEESHLNFMVYNKSVLITGEVPDESVYSYINKKAQLQSESVKKVINEATIEPNSGIISRSKDFKIRAEIELLFLNQEVFHPSHIRIMTENQTVHLMGAVTNREATKALKITKEAGYVKKVIKHFDYLKTRPAAEIERDRQRELAALKKAELKKQQAVLDAKKSKLKQELRALGGNAEGTPF